MQVLRLPRGNTELDRKDVEYICPEKYISSSRNRAYRLSVRGVEGYYWVIRKNYDIHTNVRTSLCNGQEWYIVKKSTYSYSMLRISAPREFPPHISHFESCSSWGNESRNICHFESFSLWELLILGNWIKDCRRYGPSFVLTSAAIVDGDTVRILSRRPCCLRCFTSLSREICYFILTSGRNPFKNRLTS